MGNKREPFLPDTIYHVYNHGNSSDNIFRCDENFRYFLTKYYQYITPIADTFAYCLMPNHFHFALRIKEEEYLRGIYKKKLKDLNTTEPQGFENLEVHVSRTFGNFLNAYAKAFNKMYDRRGSLFLANIRRKKVEDESYFTKLIHYIHYNPVHHGFVRKLEDWKFSSYHSLVSTKATQMKRDYVLEWFGGLEEFKKFHLWKPKVDFEKEF